MAKETERDRLLRDMKEAGNQPVGFKRWWKDVFMYHYFKPILIGIVALTIVGIFVWDMFQDHSYDFTFTIIANNYISEDSRADMTEVFSKHPGDINDSGELEIAVEDYVVTSAGDSTDAAQVMNALQVSFVSDPSSVLYLLHEDFLNYFAPATSYRKLADLGLEGADEYFISAEGCKLVAEAFPLDDPSEYYFAFKTCEVSKRDDPEYIEYYDAAVDAVNALLAAE